MGTDGTLDLGTVSEKAVTCEIIGSFTETPKIYAACEGHFTSSMGEVKKHQSKENTYTVEITIRPTTAYAGDNLGGKLSVYCPYYGNTGIGQINLKAKGAGGLVLQSTNIEPLTILEKPANNATASITFTLDEGEDAPPSNRLPVIIDNNYTLTDVQSVVTNNGTKDVETGSGFSQNLDYEGNAGWIKLGDFKYDSQSSTFTQKFTLENNDSTEKPRTGAVVVFSPSGREVARFVIKQEAKVVDNTPVINLVETNDNKAANCYIISEPGRYQIDTYMGAYNPTDLKTASKCTGTPEVIWNEGGNDITPCQVGFSDCKLIFDVKGTIKPGNAIIGIRNPNDANDILWSWHLWFCESTNRPDNEKFLHKYPKSEVLVMNRALGATENTGLVIGENDVSYWLDGLYYQSGRKDPIRLNSSGKAAYDEVSKNSDIEFDKNWTSDGWTASKSVQDPCPPGYKVPDQAIWSTDVNNGTLETLSSYVLKDVYPYNLEASTNVQRDILYPLSGYIDTDGSYSTGDNGSSQDMTLGSGSSLGGLALNFNPTYNYSSNTRRRYKNIKCKKVVMDYQGYIWANEKKAFMYHTTGSEFIIIQCEYQTGTPGKYFGTTWNEDWKVIKAEDLLDGELEAIKTYLNTRESISNFGSSANFEPEFVNNINSSVAYPVRCVKE